jgi:hypothetical protein
MARAMVLLLVPPPLTLVGSRRRRAGDGSAVRVARPASEAALVGHASVVAQHASLVHDVAEGTAVSAEAALWSGLGAELDLEDDP